MKSPLLHFLFFHKKEMSQQTHQEVDMLRYRENKLASGFGYTSLVFFSVAFCLVYSNTEISKQDKMSLFGISSSGFWVGADILINILLLLLMFLAVAKMEAYSRGWGILSIAVGLCQIVRAFLYPLSLLQAGILAQSFYIAVAIFYILSGVCFLLAGISTVILHNVLAKYLKTVKPIEDERCAR